MTFYDLVPIHDGYNLKNIGLFVNERTEESASVFSLNINQGNHINKAPIIE